MTPESTFVEFIDQYQLAKNPLLVMVSGGVDSMVLLHVAAKLHLAGQVFVLHVNHNARPEASDDAVFVESACLDLGVNCTTKMLKTAPTKDAENSWRKERLNAVKALSAKEKAHWVTAHHATDLVETVLHRMAKGAGVTGLSPFDNSHKPFWKLSKQSILDYAATEKIAYREDETNADERFERNLLRHKVLPELRKITPNLEQVFVRNAQMYAQYADFIQTILPQNNSIQLADFATLHPLVQSEWLRGLCPQSPSGDELSDCLRWLKNSPKGNTKKQLGGITLHLKNGLILVLN